MRREDPAKVEAELSAAREALTVLEEEIEAAHQHSENATVGGLSDYDPAILSGIRRKPNAKKDARRYAAYDREAEASRRLIDARKRVAVLQGTLDYLRRTAPVPFTDDDLKHAALVRDDMGWHKVARVNAKSVSVLTGYSWVDRIPIEQVLEVRRADA